VIDRRTALQWTSGLFLEPVELSCGTFSIGKFLSRIVVSVGFGLCSGVGGMVVNGENLWPGLACLCG
jgi:hypothetical protein